MTNEIKTILGITDSSQDRDIEFVVSIVKEFFIEHFNFDIDSNNTIITKYFTNTVGSPFFAFKNSRLYAGPFSMNSAVVGSEATPIRHSRSAAVGYFELASCKEKEKEIEVTGLYGFSDISDITLATARLYEDYKAAKKTKITGKVTSEKDLTTSVSYDKATAKSVDELFELATNDNFTTLVRKYDFSNRMLF